MGTPNFKNTSSVTIANGQSLSGASAQLAGTDVVGLVADAAWDTNAVTFQASYDGTNFFDLFSLDVPPVELTLAGVVAQKWYPLDPSTFFGVSYIKVRSGTAGAAVAQNGATVITLVLRPIA